MKVAVTGARGRVGAYVVYDLLAHGYEVKAVSRTPWDKAPEGVEQVTGIDLTDFEAVKREFAGCDAVIHVANVPAAWYSDTPYTFTNNMNANYNVMLACGLLGINRLVITSSVCAMGHVYGREKFPGFDAFPITEEDNIYPCDPYGISKKFTEELGECMCRRFPGMHIALLRISATYFPEWYREIVTDPQLKSVNTYMREDYPFRHNLGTYTDARDSARAHVLAMENTPLGSNVYYICAPDTFSCRPTADCLAMYPKVPLRRPIGKYEALESSRKAMEVLGWKPRYFFWPELALCAKEAGVTLDIPQERLTAHEDYL